MTAREIAEKISRAINLLGSFLLDLRRHSIDTIRVAHVASGLGELVLVLDKLDVEVGRGTIVADFQGNELDREQVHRLQDLLSTSTWPANGESETAEIEALCQTLLMSLGIQDVDEMLKAL